VCVGIVAFGAGASYRVQKGDTLSSIAKQHGVPLAELAAANRISDPNRIVVGRVLDIPGRPDNGFAASPPAPVAPSPAASPAAPAAPASTPPGTELTGIVPASWPERLRKAPERHVLVPSFQKWADANGIPVDLVMGTAWVESGWQNHVVSHKGAMGIGQLMPGTVEFVRANLIGVAILDPKVPEDNIRMMARYLRWLLERAKGDTTVALAGYYQGPTSVQRDGVNKSTRQYVDAVQTFRKAFASIA
jgi:soluble lytic murein transglycosylase-like protein